MRWQPLPARWREIILSDADFHDWPLGERAVIESLQEWARGGRRLTFLACNYNEVIRRHARLVRWRTTWDHILTCRACPAADPLDIPAPSGPRSGFFIVWTPTAVRV
jgi:hypothetical protein